MPYMHLAILLLVDLPTPGYMIGLTYSSSVLSVCVMLRLSVPVVSFSFSILFLTSPLPLWPLAMLQ